MSWNENDYITKPKVGRAIGIDEFIDQIKKQRFAETQRNISKVRGQILLHEIAEKVKAQGSSLLSSTCTSRPDLTTIGEAKRAYKRTNDPHEEDSAFDRWLELCTTTWDAKRAYYGTSIRRHEDRAFRRWLELCTTTCDAKRAYYGTNREQDEDLAFRRWLHLCKTYSEARAAFQSTNRKKHEEWAQARMKQLK